MVGQIRWGGWANGEPLFCHVGVPLGSVSWERVGVAVVIQACLLSILK